MSVWRSLLATAARWAAVWTLLAGQEDEPVPQIAAKFPEVVETIPHAYRVLPGPGYSPSRGSAGSSTAAAEMGEEVRPRPKRLPRARSVEAPITDAREVERLAHRVEQYSLHMAGLLRRGVLEPSMVYAFFMTKGGQQVPQPKSKAKARARNREMMKEGVEQTPGVSPPRLQPERPPAVFLRGETLVPSTARPKVRISRKSRPQSIGKPSQE